MHFTGTDPLTLEYDNPYLELIDTQTTGETWRVKGSVDTTAWLDFDYLDTTWKHLIRLPYDPENVRARFDMECQLRNVIVRDDSPYVTWEGLEASAEIYKIEEETGALKVMLWNDPSWETQMRFNTGTIIEMLVPLHIDKIYEQTTDANIQCYDYLVAREGLNIIGGLAVQGDPPIETNKCVRMNNLDMKLVCTITFTTANIAGGEGQGTNNQYVYRKITGETELDCMIFYPVITSANLEGAGSKGVQAVIVYEPFTVGGDWKVCLIIHDHDDHHADEVIVEVYQWQHNPADHT